MQKIGIHFGPHIPPGDRAVLQVIEMVYGDKSGVALAMEGSHWITNAMPDGSIVVCRHSHLFRDSLSLLTEGQCYDLGFGKGKAVGRVTGYLMGMCEPEFDTWQQARNLGTFDAGLGDATTAGLCSLNIAMGKGESRSTPTKLPLIEVYCEAFNHYSQRFDLTHKNPDLLWGYHMYSSPGIDDKWLGLRPWEFWKADIAKMGFVMPDILGTEAGLDVRGVGGYKAYTTSDQYAAYIREWPERFPKAVGGCFFGYRMGDDWWSFDYEADQIVLNAMKEVNMTTGDFSRQMDYLWDTVQNRIWAAPAFRKVYLQHPELGAMLGAEFDVGEYRFQACEFGYICARIGDWGNSRVVTRREDMPPFG